LQKPTHIFEIPSPRNLAKLTGKTNPRIKEKREICKKKKKLIFREMRKLSRN